MLGCRPQLQPQLSQRARLECVESARNRYLSRCIYMAELGSLVEMVNGLNVLSLSVAACGRRITLSIHLRSVIYTDVFLVTD